MINRFLFYLGSSRIPRTRNDYVKGVMPLNNRVLVNRWLCWRPRMDSYENICFTHKIYKYIGRPESDDGWMIEWKSANCAEWCHIWVVCSESTGCLSVYRNYLHGWIYAPSCYARAKRRPFVLFDIARYLSCRPIHIHDRRLSHCPHQLFGEYFFAS